MTAGRLKIWNADAEEWEYPPGGGITEITSDDESVTITNGTGPVVDLSAGGGSQTVKCIRVPIAFNTPNLLTGITIYVPTARDYWVATTFSVTEAWDGTTPSGNLFMQGDTPEGDSIVNNSMDVPDGPANAGTGLTTPADIGFVKTEKGLFFADATPLMFAVTDGSGGDPGASQGAGEVIIEIVAAS